MKISNQYGEISGDVRWKLHSKSNRNVVLTSDVSPQQLSKIRITCQDADLVFDKIHECEGRDGFYNLKLICDGLTTLGCECEITDAESLAAGALVLYAVYI